MTTHSQIREINTPINRSLFSGGIEEQILLSVHLLGKPTAAQLFRLHEREVGTLRRMQGILRRLSTGRDRMLSVIKPIDIAKPIRSLPFVYLDTTKSRRYVEQRFGVPFRRPPEVPSRDWRFLRHDVTMVDELIAFELTAKKLCIPFGYQPLIDADGKHVLPKVEIAHNGLTHRLRPQPDKILIVGNTHIFLEHDCGQETIECGNIIRDATIGRKHLVYDQLFRTRHLQRMGWTKVIVVYVVEGKGGSQLAALRRIKRFKVTMPANIDHQRFWFIDRKTLLSGKEGIALHQWQRGDGFSQRLACFEPQPVAA